MSLFRYVIKIIKWFCDPFGFTNKAKDQTQTNNKPHANWIYDSQYFLQQYPRPQSRHDISQAGHLFRALSPADLAQLTGYQLHQLQQRSMQQLLPLHMGDEGQTSPAVKKGPSGINQLLHYQAQSLMRTQAHGTRNLCATEPFSHEGECCWWIPYFATGILNPPPPFLFANPWQELSPPLP